MVPGCPPSNLICLSYSMLANCFDSCFYGASRKPTLRFIVISATFARSAIFFIPILHPLYLSFLSWSRTLSTCPLYPSHGIVHSCGLGNRPLILVPQFRSVCLSFYPRLRNLRLSACPFILVSAISICFCVSFHPSLCNSSFLLSFRPAL